MADGHNDNLIPMMADVMADLRQLGVDLDSAHHITCCFLENDCESVIDLRASEIGMSTAAMPAGVTRGVFTVNEVREAFGLPPLIAPAPKPLQFGRVTYGKPEDDPEFIRLAALESEAARTRNAAIKVSAAPVPAAVKPSPFQRIWNPDDRMAVAMLGRAV